MCHPRLVAKHFFVKASDSMLVEFYNKKYSIYQDLSDLRDYSFSVSPSLLWYLYFENAVYILFVM